MSAPVSRRSTIIKAGVDGLGEMSTRPFYLTDVLNEAKELIASQRAKADALVATAERKAASIREQAREAGRQEGLETGRQEGFEDGRREAFEQAKKDFAEQQASVVNACHKMINEIEAGRAGWEAAARRDLIDLAMAIARRVVHQVGQREREAVTANLEEAVCLVGARSDVAIIVNPADAEAAQVFAKSLTDRQEQWQHVRVVGEAEISPGGCCIRWDSGMVDATLETQLDRIEVALKNDAADDGEVE